MKHLIIGDLHGKDVWDEVDISSYDKVVFVGDYVDHWTLPDRFIYQNLQKIIELKRENFEKVELLLGNHDIQYLHYPHYLCSGFRPNMQRSLNLLFGENRELFKVAYQRENHIISHAGITNKWYRELVITGLLKECTTKTRQLPTWLTKLKKRYTAGCCIRQAAVGAVKALVVSPGQTGKS